MVVKDIFEAPDKFIKSVLTESEYILLKLMINDLGYSNFESYFQEAIYSNDLIYENFNNRFRTPIHKRVNRFMFEKSAVLGFPRLINFKPFTVNKGYIPLFTRRERFRQYFWGIHFKVLNEFFVTKFTDPSFTLNELALDLRVAKGYLQFIGVNDDNQSKLVSHLEVIFKKREHFAGFEEKQEYSIDQLPQQDLIIQFQPIVVNHTIKFPIIRLGDKGDLISPIIKTICERGFCNQQEGLCALFDLTFKPTDEKIIWMGSVVSVMLFFDLLIQYDIIDGSEHFDIPEYVSNSFLYITDEGNIEIIKKKTARRSRDRFDKQIDEKSDIISSNLNHKMIFEIILHHHSKFNLK